jgi:L-ascorbate metabolism protein UlaG (beta-lactamase superfamily)
MQITKRGHACLQVELGGVRLVIDPGNYTESLAGLTDVVAIVVTHQHDDHCSAEQLEALRKTNPEVMIFGTAEVVAKLATLPVHTVHHGDRFEVEGFVLEFIGDLHQEIHRSIPLIQNTGVLVNSKLYYPGDSYTRCDYPFEVLACPASAPWLKIGDVIDFLDAQRPAKCFSTHNALLSELGHQLQNSRIKEVTERNGGEYRYLAVGQSWQI